MIHVSHRTRCSGCSACQAMCPHGAITMRADGMGFRYPEVDTARCTDCGLCEKIDPFRACQKTTVPTAEAIRFPDLLDRSQSGGLGFALMRKAIREGWVVYGAAIDNDFTARHRRVEQRNARQQQRFCRRKAPRPAQQRRGDGGGGKDRRLRDLQGDRVREHLIHRQQQVEDGRQMDREMGQQPVPPTIRTKHSAAPTSGSHSRLPDRFRGFNARAPSRRRVYASSAAHRAHSASA